MSNLGEHTAKNPLDLSRLDGVTDPKVFDREYHSAIRDHLQSGGFLPPTEGVTKDAEDPEDTDGFFDSIINKVFAFKGSDAFETPQDKYHDKRFDFVAGSSRYSETMFKDRLGRTKIGYDYNLSDPELRDMAKSVLGKSDKDIDAIASGKAGISARDARVLYEARISRAERHVKNTFEGVALGDNQRMALVSLAYQNEKLIGPKLTKYVKNGEWDKAEAEIRERSNRYKLDDIAQRRSMEADMFRGMTAPQEETAPGEEPFSLSSLFGFGKEEAPAQPEAQQAENPEDDPLYGYHQHGQELAKQYREEAGKKLKDLELTDAEGNDVQSANAMLSVIPAHVRMLVEDVIKTQFGVDKTDEIKTSDFFSDDELVGLMEVVKRSYDANGGARSGAVEYTGKNSGYEDGVEDVKFNQNDLDLGGSDSSSVIKKTLGQFNWRFNDQDELIITDTYDFNDAAKYQEKYPTEISRMTHLMGLAGKMAMSGMANMVGSSYDGGENIGLYGLVRRAAALYGSKEGEGMSFEINLGKVDFDKIR